MNIMPGDNPLEDIAVRLSDVKVRDAHIAENRQVQETRNEQVKKTANNGVVIELSKSGRNTSDTEQINTEAVKKVQNDVKDRTWEKAERIAMKTEERKVADTQRVLENINIY